MAGPAVPGIDWGSDSQGAQSGTRARRTNAVRAARNPLDGCRLARNSGNDERRHAQARCFSRLRVPTRLGGRGGDGRRRRFLHPTRRKPGPGILALVLGLLERAWPQRLLTDGRPSSVPGSFGRERICDRWSTCAFANEESTDSSFRSWQGRSAAPGVWRGRRGCVGYFADARAGSAVRGGHTPGLVSSTQWPRRGWWSSSTSIDASVRPWSGPAADCRTGPPRTIHHFQRISVSTATATTYRRSSASRTSGSTGFSRNGGRTFGPGSRSRSIRRATSFSWGVRGSFRRAHEPSTLPSSRVSRSD